MSGDIYKGSTETYSAWISTKPYDPNGNEFINLCSDASLSYSVQYQCTTTGLLGSGPDKAILVDGVGGAVGNISISGTRVNKAGSTDISSQILTNAEFDSKMEEMVTVNQMFSNAYVLRIFRADWQKSGEPYRDLYVFFHEYSSSLAWNSMNEMGVNFSFYRRNLGKGFGSE